MKLRRMLNTIRRACQFSCGAASAVATKLTLNSFPNVIIVNAFLKEEDEDNRRFLRDCETWFGRTVLVLKDQEYGASTLEVFRRKRFIKGLYYAPCSMLLKRRLLAGALETEDIRVIGYTSEEDDRARELEENFPDENFEFPLIDYGLSKYDCLAIINDTGIELPRMYRIGYDNANCIGCPKGGQNYWQRIRRDFPERFIQIKSIQEDIGPGANFLRFRSGPRINERMSLAELPDGDGNLAEEASFSCSFYCEGAKSDLGV